MAKSSAERQRLSRARRRTLRAVLRIEVDELAVADMLVEKRFLQAWDADDRKKIEAALEQALGYWTQYRHA